MNQLYNITGEFTHGADHYDMGNNTSKFAAGVFTVSSGTNSSVNNYETAYSSKGFKVSFNASKLNAIFNGASTNQVASIYQFILIKI